ncbi:hypothetical protein Ari01nite_89620 [Paractinoplanes rishiriensis]|uniref:Uncharacterized protein n=2 Tax=Paractinoplanes rishiriensis TaxID=1050105 RepID=A0A919N2R4_9ACTN|nr:hypothetical protein Ari01nite_89620 [Actinoplanes rishiriensis]
MSIDDEELAEVWPAFEPGLSPKENRQLLYANIIYQFQWTSLKLDNADNEAVLRTLEYLFTSQKIRRYWAAAARARESLVPGSPEYLFAKEADRICRDYNAVASNSSNVEQNVTNYKESSGRSPRKQPNAATRSEHPGLGKIVSPK